MIQHIGLTIRDKKEIETFYKDLLNLEEEKSFILSKELNQKVFGFYEEIEVFWLKNEKLTIEIFITKLPVRKSHNYTHLCFEVKNRENFIAKAKKLNYRCNIIQRENKADLVFVKDHYGNHFEIKEQE